MWQLPIVEHPSCVPTSSRGWYLQSGDAAAQRGTAVGTVHSASGSSHHAGKAWGSIGECPQNSKGFASGTRQCLFFVCSLASGDNFLTLCGHSRNQPCSLEMLGKIRSCGKEKEKKRRRQRNRSLCACSIRGFGAQVGREPITRWGWQARREGLPCPCSVLQHKGSARSPPWSGWPWKPFSSAASLKARNPTPSAGPPASCWGYWGQQWEGLPGAPGCPLAAWLHRPEEMPRRSRVIFWINRVSFDLGFKTSDSFPGC